MLCHADLTDFKSGASNVQFHTISLSQLASINPEDLVTKIKALFGLVMGLFGFMLAWSAVMWAADSAGRRRMLTDLMRASGSASCGFRNRPGTGEWLWALPPASAEEDGALSGAPVLLRRFTLHTPQEAKISRLAQFFSCCSTTPPHFSIFFAEPAILRFPGPLVNVAAIVGVPVGRLRAAIPDELHRGSFLHGVGFAGPASVAAFSEAAGRFPRKLLTPHPASPGGAAVVAAAPSGSVRGAAGYAGARGGGSLRGEHGPVVRAGSSASVRRGPVRSSSSTLAPLAAAAAAAAAGGAEEAAPAGAESAAASAPRRVARSNSTAAQGTSASRRTPTSARLGRQRSPSPGAAAARTAGAVSPEAEAGGAVSEATEGGSPAARGPPKRSVSSGGGKAELSPPSPSQRRIVRRASAGGALSAATGAIAAATAFASAAGSKRASSPGRRSVSVPRMASEAADAAPAPEEPALKKEDADKAPAPPLRQSSSTARLSASRAATPAPGGEASVAAVSELAIAATISSPRRTTLSVPRKIPEASALADALAEEAQGVDNAVPVRPTPGSAGDGVVSNKPDLRVVIPGPGTLRAGTFKQAAEAAAPPKADAARDPKDLTDAEWMVWRF